MSFANHILLATDFSEAADAAIEKTVELSRAFGSKLIVLHVHGRPPGAPEAVVSSEIQVSSDVLDAISRQNLEQLKKDKFSDVESVELVAVEHVSPALAICKYSQEHGVDLIVMGTHGRTGVSHFLIGSVAEKVVRHASCAVLIARP